jgi:3-oxoacyl-[acyl-carrier protein] reductase
MSDLDQPLAGRLALVTGGSSGIGVAVCDRLLALGARVTSLALDRRTDATDPRLTQVVVDLADARAVKEYAAQTQGRADVDILVNNAGIVITRPLEDVTDDDFDRLMNVHVRAAILLAQAVTPGMKQRRAGRIVNVATRAIVGMPGRTTYSASKAALVSITRTWALELAPFGITVNAVSPGPIATPMLTRELPEESERARALAASIPLKRLGRAEDVARAIAFFVDPASSWITGQNLFVCGGASLASSPAL